MLIDTHTHTVASTHAYSSLQENVEAAKEKGLKILGMTDHGPTLPSGAPAVFFANLRAIPNIIDGIRILKGAEVNITDYEGSIDLEEEILDNLDIVIASMHNPCVPYGTKKQNTNTLIKAMENPRIHIIGHPGDPRYPIDVLELVNASIRTKTFLEINNASLFPNGFRLGSDKYMGEILNICSKKDMPIILGSDAHFSSSVGEFGYAIKLIDETKFPHELIINTSIGCFSEYTGISLG